MERHYIFQLVEGMWHQISGWYPSSALEECGEALEDLRQDYPLAKFTVMTQSGELV